MIACAWKCSRSSSVFTGCFRENSQHRRDIRCFSKASLVDGIEDIRGDNMDYSTVESVFFCGLRIAIVVCAL